MGSQKERGIESEMITLSHLTRVWFIETFHDFTFRIKKKTQSDTVFDFSEASLH